MTDRSERRDGFTEDRPITTFNRKAIMVGLMVVAVAVMVATFFLSPTPGDRRPATEAISPQQVAGTSDQPTYLARPPDTSRLSSRTAVGFDDRNAAAAAPVDPDRAHGDAVDLFAAEAALRQSLEFAGPLPRPEHGYADAHLVSGTARALSPAEPRPAEPPPSPEEQAFELAMRCGVRSCPADVPAGWEGLGTAGETALLTPGAIPGRPATAPAGSPASPTAAEAPESQDRFEAFLARAGSSDGETRIGAALQPPASPYQIMAGTLIPVTLVTAINSDLPGEVIAQVTRNVYDTHQLHLLIPAGTRFLGKVDKQVGMGQSRVNIGWYRMILPNNHSLSLPALAGMDREGATGVRDRVDHHTRRNLASALMLSAIGAAAQLSQPQAGLLSAPSAGAVAVGGAAQRINEVSAEMIRRGMATSPTLHVRQGFNFYVYVSRDLVLQPYSPGAAR